MERKTWPNTRGQMFLAVCVVAFAMIAVVALLSGRELVAALTGFGAVGLILAGHSSESTAWGRSGRRWSMSESDFNELVDDVDRRKSAGTGTPVNEGVGSRDPDDPLDFAALISEALDELPDFMQDELRGNVAVVVSDEGAESGLYGLYSGGTVARDDVGDRILIFRDSLVRDFGDDPDELRRQVTITVRHELAHHLGANERHVTDLGL